MKWKHRLGTAGAVFLGLVLLVATWAKGVEPGAFAEQIRLEELDFLFSARTVTLLALALEAGLGTVLFLGLRRIWILIPTGLLVTFFLFLTGRNYWLVMNGLRDPDAACGCFGSLLERTAGEAFWQDLLLLVPPLVLACFWRQVKLQAFPWRRLAAAFLVMVGVLFWAGSDTGLQMVEIVAEIEGENDPAGVERFLPNPEYVLVVQDQEVLEANIYQSEESVSFLVVNPRVPYSILLRIKSRTVETLPSDQVSMAAEGFMMIASEGGLTPQGQFQLGPEGIAFTVDGVEMRLGAVDR
ncbi:MAG: MauE/DoxX family redox-associated membrane protein [Acidobacteriota bacterium]